MKISDVLRKMADIVDGGNEFGDKQLASTNPENTAFTGHLEPVELPDTNTDTTAERAGKTPAGNDEQPEDLFIPPLQMKMELLKKAVDVENIYDDGTPEEQEFQRESSEGEWSGPEHTYDYVGASQTEAAVDKEQPKQNPQVDRERAEEVDEDIHRIAELSGHLSEEQLDELSPKTLKSYAKKSAGELAQHSGNLRQKQLGSVKQAWDGKHPKTGEAPIEWDQRKQINRKMGIDRAVGKLEEGGEDMSRMKELAGINPVILDELTSDFPE